MKTIELIYNPFNGLYQEMVDLLGDSAIDDDGNPPHISAARNNNTENVFRNVT